MPERLWLGVIGALVQEDLPPLVVLRILASIFFDLVWERKECSCNSSVLFTLLQIFCSPFSQKGKTFSFLGAVPGNDFIHGNGFFSKGLFFEEDKLVCSWTAFDTSFSLAFMLLCSIHPYKIKRKLQDTDFSSFFYSS